ncbi:MAG: phospho-N-acetylmuramoyl-pentapeptide-transferase [Calditrichae bacterium]|nr:phospho-N-acetylmuramoyl-pentapeptide-transferase [Calditrichia bacterium]
MLADFLFQFRDVFFGFNVFRYITVRAALAAITALLFSLVIGPKIIRLLKNKQLGEEIRHDGPQSHLSKRGTPTMGGFILLGAIIVSVLLWAKLSNFYIQLIFLATLWMGIVGFIDDYLKVVKKMEKGLISHYKLAGQITLGIILGSTLYFNPDLVEAGLNSKTSVPFFKNYEIDFGIVYIPIAIFVLTGTSNAVNLTDGLDGLSTGLVAIAMLAFGGMSYVTGNVNFSGYLNIVYLPGTGELTVYCLTLVGAAMGFLWYNTYPAEVFMGDTGSLALGGALGTVAMLIKKELLLILIGGVFVAETVSVILQSSYFKYTRKKYGQGKRIFRMAPLHHHLELKGWPESKVVARLWIIGILLALLSLTTFKVR